MKNVMLIHKLTSNNLIVLANLALTRYFILRLVRRELTASKVKSKNQKE